MYLSLLPTLALATQAFAATKSSSASSSKSTGSSTKTHTIMVSNTQGALTFSPSILSAAVGHQIDFMFHPNNHSVVQAAFDSPCAPMESSTSMKGMQGFFSGFMPVAANTTSTKTFTITVNSTNPMWFYCSQGKHCQEGMVGVINPTNTSGQTVESFAAACKGAANNVSPARVAGGTVKEVSAANAAAAATGTQTTKAGNGGKATATAKTTKANAKATTAVAANAATSAVNSLAVNAQATGSSAVSIAAASAVSTAAKNGTGITQSNVAARMSGLLDFGSSLSLMVGLAGSLMLLA